MHALLLLFPEYRALLAERKRLDDHHSVALADIERLRGAIRDLQTEKLMLQDRLDAAIEDRTKLWGMANQCIEQERLSYHMQINAQWQKQGFGAPYPEDPKLPASAVPSGEPVQGPKRPVFPSQRVARATGAFLDQYVEWRGREMSPAEVPVP